MNYMVQTKLREVSVVMTMAPLVHIFTHIMKCSIVKDIDIGDELRCIWSSYECLHSHSELQYDWCVEGRLLLQWRVL